MAETPVLIPENSESPVPGDAAPAGQSGPLTREEKLRQLWLKDKEKRKGQPKKVKNGLRRKLFFMIVSLIVGLLISVYLITLQDEEVVLRRELKIRGGTVARNLSDSIYNSYTDLVTKKLSDPFATDPQIPGNLVPLPFFDAMKKASEQQDFINGYAIDPQNRVFIEPGQQKYLFPKKTPEGVFDFKAIYPVKLAFEKIIETEKIPVTGITPDMLKKYTDRFLAIKEGTELTLLDVPEEGLKVGIKLIDGSIHLTVSGKGNDKLLNLNFTPKRLPELFRLALGIIGEETDEFNLFLNNTISDLRKLRRTAGIPADKRILKSVFSGLEAVTDDTSIIKNKVLAKNTGFVPVLKKLQEKGIRDQAQTILTSLDNYIKRFKPIVQILKRKTSEKLTENILYITYPMCETDKYFSTYRGEVHLLLSQQGIIYTINYAASKLQVAAALAVVAGTVFTIIMAFFITGPIKKLMTAMRRVGGGDLNQTVYVRVSDEIGVLADNFNEMTEGLREKEKIRNAMNKAVSKEIAEVMLSGELKLGGDNKYVTVLFSDIRGFTTISENLTAEAVVSLLNEYLTLMTNIIEKHRGIVDKFVGDEIMALWGAPKSYGNDAMAAVKTALEMMDTLNRFNDEQRAKGKLPIDIGIGLNTGEVIAANMGSENRMNYTVIGDAVNLGARLEGTNKMYGTHVIISEFTERELRGLIYCRELDLIRVKGKNEPVCIYEVMGLTPEGEAVRTTAD